jgi:hypothetical protein
MHTLRKLTVYKIFQLLYVNDGAFPFPTCATLVDGLALIQSHLAQFGLEVHIGQNGEPSKIESEQDRTAREDAKYDTLPETAQNDVVDGYVTFTCKFKYLGSRISFNLCDDDNINDRLAAALQSMGALKEVWHNPCLNTYSKYLLFHAIPINPLLWK